jgi:hypothetical protein
MECKILHSKLVFLCKILHSKMPTFVNYRIQDGLEIVNYRILSTKNYRLLLRMSKKCSTFAVDFT